MRTEQNRSQTREMGALNSHAPFGSILTISSMPMRGCHADRRFSRAFLHVDAILNEGAIVRRGALVHGASDRRIARDRMPGALGDGGKE